MLSGSLTALVNQSLRDGTPNLRYVYAEENAPGDPVRALIREAKIGMLSTYIDRIAARLAQQPTTLPPSIPPAGAPPANAAGGKQA
jgi:hypothetical protein